MLTEAAQLGSLSVSLSFSLAASLFCALTANLPSYPIANCQKNKNATQKEKDTHLFKLSCVETSFSQVAGVEPSFF